ncbi:RidA family protein [Telmatospirillum siberiense]|uniref:Translation initiation inhibitor n=1 Tax=Telmatospirillum siberiense TaxID=382514 RepID=A0A2N3PSR0_9PROT|nr:RidA family protein [Telmatospirillum siberiense]PKU23440.1 translation initiation inhibitor [Telmatospirillum siberiense]
MPSQIDYLNPSNAPPAQGLYSHATRVSGGSLLFVAGQLAVGTNGDVVGKGDFEAQFHQVFKNLAVVLQGIGGDFRSVVKFTTYLVHSQDIDRFMALRAALFPGLFPNRLYPPNTLLIVDRLVKEDFLLEVEAVVGSG